MIRIDTGLFDKMVLQRTAANQCDVFITGQADTYGDVWVKVTKNGKIVPGFKARRIGKVNKGKLNARLRGLPTGGPYTVQLHVCGKTDCDALTIHHVLVGDVWILGGQSNMQGSAPREGAVPAMKNVHAFYCDDHWDVAKDPIHTLWNAVDPVHGGKPDGKDPEGKGVGPGVPFGQAMFKATSVPQGLIACGHGGTSMTQWDPALKKQGGHSLYGAMVRRFHKNGGRVAGVIWYQGESDARAEDEPLYTGRMVKLVAAMRRDMKSPRLPFVGVQLSWYAGENFKREWWNPIQEQQRRLCEKIKQCVFVPAHDLPLCDVIHISGKGHAILGGRLAAAMLALATNGRQGRLPIALRRVSVTTGNSNHKGSANVVAEFDHVAGALRADGLARGFTLHQSMQTTTPGIYHAETDKNRVILHCYPTPIDLGGYKLSHVWGVAPVSTIMDADGWPLPVIHGATIGKARLVTPFAPAFEVSEFLPDAGKLEGLAYPANLGTIKFTRQNTEEKFLNVNPAVEKNPGNHLLYLRCRLNCPSDMHLSALFGYDGPVKLWIDSREVFADPHGTNPAVADGTVIPFKAAAGSHEILVGLGTNNGLAWGIYLRFERPGIPAAQVEKLGEASLLPRFE